MDVAFCVETVFYEGFEGAQVEAYRARVAGDRPRGGVVVIHHLPGYDRESKEFVRRFAAAGYDALCPNLYSRAGRDVDPDDAAAAARAAGGVPDVQVSGDLAAAAAHLRALSGSNGTVATIGHCSGGRQSFLAAMEVPLDAAIVCYGGLIAGEPRPQMASMVPLLGRAAEVGCPLLGLWGNDDVFPTPTQVDEIDAALTAAGKDHEFHRYDSAGHGFFSPDRPAYRVEAALDGWDRIWAFLGRHLGS